MTGYRRRIPGLNSEQVMHAMGIDDAYRVQRVLVRNANGVTELVTIEDAGPFIRKKMPLERANRAVWAALAGNACSRLPQVAATYEMPDWFVAVYDYVPGETLADAVVRAGALDAETAVQTAQDVCEALSALHDKGVVHLDIAPANVLLAADGAHVIDFGNAQVMGAAGAATGGRPLGTDAPGRFRPKGTWGFAAPEQFFVKADERSDIFAVGRLLGYMLTGVQPDDDRISEFETALMDEDRVPAALRAVIDRATSFEPSARYQSVDELSLALSHAALDRGLDGSPGAATIHSVDAADSVAANAAASTVPAAPGSAADGGASSVWDGGRKEDGVGRRGARRFRPGRIALVILACATALMSLTVCVKVLAGKGAADKHPSVQQSAGDDVGGLGGESPAPNNGGNAPDGDGSIIIEATASDIKRAFECLEITDSGWCVDSTGYVNYAVTVQNSSDDLIIEYPEVIITGRAADGSVVFSESQVMGVVYPGYNLTFASITGNGTAPATVEFSLGEPRDYQVSVGTGHPTEYKVHGLATREGANGELTVSGEVEKTVEGDEAFSPQSVWLSVILRDDQGRIVYGWSEFVDSPGLGGRIPFSVACYGCPDYKTVEVVPLAH